MATPPTPLIFTASEVADFCWVAGWKNHENLIDAVRVVFAESGLPGRFVVHRAQVIHSPSEGFRVADAHMRYLNTNGSTDRGLWQINNKAWPDVTDEQADDPAWASGWAFQQWSKTRDFRLWSSWNAGKHQEFWYEGAYGSMLAWCYRHGRPEMFGPVG